MNEVELRRLVIYHYNEAEKLKASLISHRLYDELEKINDA